MGNIFSSAAKQIFRNGNKHPFTSAVVLCAGTGERFSSGEITKQNFLIDNIPVCVHTIRAFENTDLIDEIVVVGRRDELDLLGKYCITYKLGKVTQIVEGGKTRQESSLAGFDMVSDDSRYVCIHDGARCLVTPELIEKTVRRAYESGAAAAAERSRDTVKYSENGEVINETLDRDRIWLVKTPQVFMCNMYRAGAYMAKKDGAAVTDDCMLAERLGFKVSLVECGSDNIKITYPGDEITAEAILKSREHI